MRKSYFESSLYKTWLKSYRLIGILLTFGFLIVALLYQDWLSNSLPYMLNPQPQETAYFITNYTTALQLCLAMMLAALITSAACFHFLHDSREYDMLHGLPVKRSSIFWSATAAAFTLLLLPLIFSTVLFALILAAHSLFAPLLLSTYFVAMLGCMVLAFGITTFAAMLTGKIAMQGVIVLLVCALPLALEAFGGVYVQRFFFGFDPSVRLVTENINPIFLIYEFLSDTSTAFGEHRTPSMGGYILFLLVGIGLTIAAFLLYRHRPSEAAGEVFAVKLLSPVTQVICGLLCAAMLYSATIHVFPFVMSHIVIEILINVFGVFLGCWIAKAMLLRTTKVRPVSKQAIFLAASLSIVMLCLHFDVTGYNRLQLSSENVSYITTHHPSEAVTLAMQDGTVHSFRQIESYDLAGDEQFIEDVKQGHSEKMSRAIADQILSQDASVFSGEEAVDAIRLQQMLSDSYQKLRPTFNRTREVPGEIACYIPITAKQADGATFKRTYSFRFQPEEMPELFALIEKLERQNKAADIQNTERILSKATLLRVGIAGSADRNFVSVTIPPEEWGDIRSVYLSDMREGLDIDTPVDKNGNTISDFAFIGVAIEFGEQYGFPIWYSYENTIAWLIENGYTTKEIYEDDLRRVMDEAGLD